MRLLLLFLSVICVLKPKPIIVQSDGWSFFEKDFSFQNNYCFPWLERELLWRLFIKLLICSSFIYIFFCIFIKKIVIGEYQCRVDALFQN